jgi:hypothetical protein
MSGVPPPAERQEDMASKLERARRALKEALELRENARFSLQRARGREVAEDAAAAAIERRRVSRTYEGVRRLSHERISFPPPQRQPARPRVPSAHTPEDSPAGSTDTPEDSPPPSPTRLSAASNHPLLIRPTARKPALGKK